MSVPYSLSPYCCKVPYLILSQKPCPILSYPSNPVLSYLIPETLSYLILSQKPCPILSLNILSQKPCPILSNPRNPVLSYLENLPNISFPETLPYLLMKSCPIYSINTILAFALCVHQYSAEAPSYFLQMLSHYCCENYVQSVSKTKTTLKTRVGHSFFSKERSILCVLLRSL